MGYVEQIQRRSGIARVSDMLQLGYSRHHLAKLLSEGRLLRPQRGWVALPGTDPLLLFAAEHRVVLTCMTVAKRHGLWQSTDAGLHVASRSRNASHNKIGTVTHWAKPAAPRLPHALIDPLENALAYIAECQPMSEAHAVWESALHQGKVSFEGLSQMRLGPAGRQLLTECSRFSDSGLESMLARVLRSMGLNVMSQIYLFGHRVDLLVEKWLVVQIDGGHHVGPQRTEDNRHDAILANNGYAVIRVSYWQVMNEMAEVQHLIMTRLNRPRP